jgi:hypothetical protein
VAVTRFGLFLAFSVVGAGVSAIQLAPAVSYVTEYSRRTATTTRATEEGSVAYSSSWSLHPEEVASLVVPEFVGNSSGGAEWARGTYWGRNVFKLNHEYAGWVVLLLAALSFFGAPARGVRYTFLGIGGVALLFGLGTHTPIWRLFYEVVPGISLFRAPSIAAFLFGFGAVTLMAYGIDRVLGLGSGHSGVGGAGDSGMSEAGETGGVGEESEVTPGKGDTGAVDPEASDRRVLVFLTAVSGLLLVATFLASSGTLTTLWTSVFYPTLGPGKGEALLRAQPFITRGFLITTLLAGATLGLVWGRQRRKVPSAVWVVAVGILVVVDLGRVDDAFIQTMSFHDWAGPDANIQYLMDQQSASDEPFRVLGMGGDPGTAGSGQDVKPGLHGLELAAGHHPNDLARYRELIGMVGSGIPRNFFDPETNGPNLPLLSILNVRFVIWPVHMYGGFPGGEPVMATSLDGQSAYEAVYEIPTLPRARLVGETVVISDEETLAYILSPEFRPTQEAVLSEPPPIPLEGGAVDGEVTWLEKTPNRLRLRVRSSGPALLVVAENWFPAWKGRVSGSEVPVMRANHTLRAVPVPAGESEVELYFDTGTLLAPLLLTLVSLLLVCGAWFLPGRGMGPLGPVRGPEEGA